LIKSHRVSTVFDHFIPPFSHPLLLLYPLFVSSRLLKEFLRGQAAAAAPHAYQEEQQQLGLGPNSFQGCSLVGSQQPARVTLAT
jgi:hypothetical protein